MRLTKAQYQSALRGEIILMTPAGQEAIRARLEELKTELAKLEWDLGYAAQDYPDLRENAIYGDLAMKIQLDLPRQRDDLREMLGKAFVVETTPKGAIGFGSRFTAAIDDVETDFALVGPAEVTFVHDVGVQVVSYISPLGRAVWGAKVGDMRTFEVGGRPRSVEVLAIHEI